MMMRCSVSRSAALVVMALHLAACAPAPEARAGGVAVRSTEIAPPGPHRTDSTFAQLVERLSEPGGFFDTDNLISNEGSYLQVLGALRRLGVSGGAYIGVGPDQNFAYIAQIRPQVAFIIDIRRDNLLQHLMFKALFGMARTRVEYLALLHGRPAPGDVRAWRDRSIQEIVAYIDSTPATPSATVAARDGILARVRGFGMPLTASDLETIGRFHQEFVRQGLDLQFASFNRAPRPYYPTYRQLLLARDLTGREGSYLARDEDFRYVKGLEARDLVVPVVGDLAGPHALDAIGREIAARRTHVSAFYTSNVEFYLLRDGSFPRFAHTAASLPRDQRSVIIRSYFGGTFGAVHPQAVPGSASTQTMQTLDSFVRGVQEGGYATYWDLVTRDAIAP